MTKKFVFRDIEKALEDLNAKDKGKYFLCECPECHRQEAFLYKNKLNVIQCNRENQCGERMILHFEDKDKIPEKWAVKEEAFPSLKRIQKEKLTELTRYLKHFQYSIECPSLENYRGLSRASTEPFMMDLHHDKLVKKMFELGTDLFQNDYRNTSFMLKRNYVFPLYGEDGQIDRILLRSNDESLEPKEIQLIVNPSKKTRDFFVDLKEDSQIVVIAESILDGASFREIDPSIDLMALTGSRKTYGLCDYIEKNAEKFRDKRFLIAMDGDLAGRKAAEKIIQTLDKNDLSFETVSYPEGIKDGNEWIIQDRQQFEEAYTEMCKNDIKKDIELEEKKVTYLGEFSFCYQDIMIRSVQLVEGIDGNNEIQLPKGIAIENDLKKQLIQKFLVQKPEEPLIIYSNPEITFNREKAELQYGSLLISSVEVDRLPDGSEPLVFFPNEKRFNNIKVSGDLIPVIIQQDGMQLADKKAFQKKLVQSNERI